MMKAGYIENWKYEKTFSGVPQGGILSPLLSNIYLNELDKFVNEELIPEYNRGKRRKHNPEYIALTQKIRKAKDTKNFELQKLLKKKRNKLPSKDTQDKNYRRLKYVRYADDFLLGFIGPIAEAQVIKEKIRKFLQEKLGLELSENKTLITHAVENKARFLGYDVSIALCNSKKSHNGRSINGNPILQVPPEITTKWKRKVCKNGKPIHRTELMHDCDYDIVSIYNAEFQGLVNYYLMAQNVAREMYKLKYVYTQSLVKTIAAKHKKNSRWVYRKYSKKFPLGIKGLEVKVDRTDGKPLLARFGSRPIKRQKMVRTKDEITIIKTNRNEILRKLLNDVCEMCGHQGNIEMHHIRKLKDLKKRYRGRKQPPEWVKKMIALNRKTIPVCKDCHRKIHNGTLC